MPSKSLTLKFGADTSRLDAALKRMRKNLGRSVTGGARRTAGAIGGGILGGFAGGALAGGLTGIGSRLFGELMDVSPEFAMSMMNLGETIRAELQPEMEDLAKGVADATPAIAAFVKDMIKGAADFIETVQGKKLAGPSPGFFTQSGVAGGLKSVGDIMSEEGLYGADARFSERLGGALGAAGSLIGMTPIGAGLGIDQTTGLELVQFLQNQVNRGREIMNWNQPAQPNKFAEFLQAPYGDEGVGPGTI